MGTEVHGISSMISVYSLYPSGIIFTSIPAQSINSCQNRLKKKPQNSQFQPLDRRYDVQGLETVDASVLDTFSYEYPGRDQEIHIETDEFTAVCPYSGLPDFATIKVDYIPDKKIIELRSFKYYLLSYRNVGIYQEHVVNKILEDLTASCKPKQMQVTADYRIRGGVHTVCSIEYRQKHRS